MKQKKRIMIVDGYNVIHLAPEFETRLRKSLEDRRISLINFCTSWLGNRKDVSEFIIVFDGDSSVLGDRAQSRSRARVIYTNTGESADSRIIALVGEYADTCDCTVVSDDHEVARETRASGGAVMAVGEFARMLTRRRRGADSLSAGTSKTGLSPATEREINERLKREWGIT